MDASMSTPKYDFTGRNALVTGGGTGIGYGIARLLMACGANVTIAGRRENVLLAAAESLRAAGPGELRTAVCDITQISQVRQTIREAAGGGNLDILVLNAGTGAPGALMQLDDDAWEQMMALNITGNAMCIKHAALVMKAHGGGSIVTISSTSGTKVQPWMSTYNVSKAGLDMLVRCASIELAPHGIRVNSIQPGYIPTDGIEQCLTTELRETLVHATPLGKSGDPDDIAQAVAFLVSDAAKWITGQALGVDGGFNVPVMPSMADVAKFVYGPEVVASYAVPDPMRMAK